MKSINATPARTVILTPLIRKFLVGLLLLILVVGMLIMKSESRLQRMLLVDPAKIYLLPDPKMSRALCLGFSEATADLAWIRALIYFGEQTIVGGRFTYLQSHVDLILGLNPMFRRAYMWAGITSIYSRRKITRQSIERGIAYLKRGVKKFPNDGEMQYMLGFDLYFELPPFLKSDEEKKKAKLEGIDHMKAAISAGDRPEWLASLVSSLLKRNGFVELAIQNIEENLKFIEDPEAQESLLLRLKELNGERQIDAYLGEMQELYAKWQREFPYLPLDMYLLVEPRALSGLGPLASLTSEVETAVDALDQVLLTQ